MYVFIVKRGMRFPVATQVHGVAVTKYRILLIKP